jgi:hypothetical protein
MNLDRQQMVGALVTLATVLFLMAVAPRFPYRRAARIAAVVIYGAVLIGVVAYVVLWLTGVVT